MRMENGKSKTESVRDKWDTGDLTYMKLKSQKNKREKVKQSNI